MLGNLTSLTGGGGFTGGAATATGRNETNSGQSVGGINMGASHRGSLPPMTIVGVVIAVVALVWVMKK
ncbi:hypothetical protein [Vibrio vulnificus]|uniref:hypothetical protein n=1 Tax=Vibrio vulnificus TaxID=672 RepID=UPI0002FCC789|nr:hypothetical protein [Vibrio vulnificus]ELI0610694.1 hypothetical protein [Vibrio vulnificus]MCA3991254.1 hypothetical protein [Vibrio vulnificus]MCU8271254.1 hypothetical protein [Vibrio vulnificus]RZQ29216.1 hypothetical protein D8T36_05495 [Vibrio vulnificus]RZR38373.1 hypothetical protein D8T59_11475 [Vibrio vulnificus]